MWCVAELDEPYIARMEDVLAVYEKPQWSFTRKKARQKFGYTITRSRY